MELLRGETLCTSRKREIRLAPHHAAGWLDQALEALKVLTRLGSSTAI
jgi:hypothetical protein